MRLSRPMRQLARQRLDARLSVLRDVPVQAWSAPNGGWIRAIREALGMPRQVLGQRMGVGERRVQQLEAGEAKGSITVDSLARAANALDCELVVALVPRVALEDQVQARRLQRAADWIQSRTLHTMVLEGQGVRDTDLPPAVVEEVERLFPDERLWDAP